MLRKRMVQLVCIPELVTWGLFTLCAYQAQIFHALISRKKYFTKPLVCSVWHQRQAHLQLWAIDLCKGDIRSTKFPGRLECDSVRSMTEKLLLSDNKSWCKIWGICTKPVSYIFNVFPFFSLEKVCYDVNQTVQWTLDFISVNKTK